MEQNHIEQKVEQLEHLVEKIKEMVRLLSEINDKTLECFDNMSVELAKAKNDIQDFTLKTMQVELRFELLEEDIFQIAKTINADPEKVRILAIKQAKENGKR
jgi:uncharacterized protein YoxC